jgi:hypothetical protein
MRPHGRARVDARNPRAFAICDRCGLLYNHIDLEWQFDWAGASLINKRSLVCDDCNDVPQNQLRAIVLPADPMPIQNPRVEPYSYDESNYRATQPTGQTDPVTSLPIPGTNGTRVTEDGVTRSSQLVGPPIGLEAGAVMPLNGKVHYGVELPVLSISSNGTTIITVTCSSVHNLITDSQISVNGTQYGGKASPNTDGFFSVIVSGSATQFTYEVNNPVPASSLLGATTQIITAKVGLPYGVTQIPKTGS